MPIFLFGFPDSCCPCPYVQNDYQNYQVLDIEGWGAGDINLHVAFHARLVGVLPGAVRLHDRIDLLELSLLAAFGLDNLSGRLFLRGGSGSRLTYIVFRDQIEKAIHRKQGMHGWRRGTQTCR